eukprot:superscaffoldBa00001106_g9002
MILKHTQAELKTKKAEDHDAERQAVPRSGSSFNRINVFTAKPTPAAQTQAPKAQIMVAAQQQLPLPSVFNPQAAPTNTRPGLPPSYVLLPSMTCPDTRPPSSQHPVPAPGFLPYQPFQAQPVPIGGPSAFLLCQLLTYLDLRYSLCGGPQEACPPCLAMV